MSSSLCLHFYEDSIPNLSVSRVSELNVLSVWRLGDECAYDVLCSFYPPLSVTTRIAWSRMARSKYSSVIGPYYLSNFSGIFECILFSFFLVIFQNPRISIVYLDFYEYINICFNPWVLIFTPGPPIGGQLQPAHIGF